MVDVQRLYVSPLDSNLLATVLSGFLHESATNISYHTLQTFPEKRYGYLELPISEADRLKKKLHGFILQGVKMKVEKARPGKARKGLRDGDEQGIEEKAKKETKIKSNLKREDGLLAGVELPNDRKVKRGWTDSAVAKGKESTKGKKSRGKENAKKPSVHTDGPECLFKTTMPPNATGHVSPNIPEATKPKKRKRGDTDRNIVVHEFEKTTRYPNFIRGETNGQQKKSAASYVDGKGWIDEAGNIIEAETESRRTRSKAIKSATGTKDVARMQKANANPKPVRGAGRWKQAKAGEQVVADETSSAGSSDSESEEDHLKEGQRSDRSAKDDVGSEEENGSENEVNTAQVRALSITRSSPTPPLHSVKDVHPLEALFKRPDNAASRTPQKPSLEVKTGFSFFEPDVEQNDAAPFVVPQTPFTQEDFQDRRLRSAAPTPDTAAPSKITFGRLWSQESGHGDSVSNEAEDDAQLTPIASRAAIRNVTDDEANEEAKESEFAKWFYEHRGETNRAWKRRRREAAKEKRQKENQNR